MQPFRLFTGLRAWSLACSWLALALTVSLRAQDVVISEIMYHPASENPREKYVEIYNRALTNVNLSGWEFSKGFNYTFPSNTVLRATNYLVVAAHLPTFTGKYPTITNVVGDFLVVRTTNVVGYTYTNYQNSISSSSDQLDLKDASGNLINTVTYADEGDWAVRKRGPLDRGYNGWVWWAEADGTGKSLELIATGAPNFSGQNWQASSVIGGTPGRVNSVAAINLAPLILEVAHSPVVPLPTNPVTVSARILDEGTNVTVRLFWRVNMLFPFGFASTNMVDDGAHGDGVAGDKIFGAVLPAQPQGTIIEFYVQATDSGNRASTWPRPAVDVNGFLLGQLANALYQVDTNGWNGVGPLHKFIMSLSESNEFYNLLAETVANSQSPESDATYNATFINVDALGLDVRYLSGIRNRGHGSRYGEPHNYRLDFPGDARWHGLSGLNLNALSPHLQVFGSALLLKSGVVGNESRAVQLRFNGGAGPGGTPAYGRYAGNEAADGDFAANHFPDDASGNIYTAIRDLEPSALAYRTTNAFPSGTYRDTYHDVNRTFINFGPEDARTYTNTYFKDSNGGQNDYTDIVALSRILGADDLFTPANVRAVINPEQWLTHVAAMAILNNQETGINSGWNDDYELYRGLEDPRFQLMFHDLDTINAGAINAGIFGSTANNGIRPAFNHLLHSSEFEPLYYQTLQRLINTTFSKPAYDSLIAQVLGPYVPANVIATLRTWMDARRSYVQQNFLNPYFAANPPPPTATVAGEPRSPTPFTSATLTVGGVNVFSYKYRLNDGPYGAETPVATPIALAGLTSGSTNVVSIIGRSPAGSWQSINSPTVSKVWVVNPAIPSVRLNEVLAQNSAALNVGGTFPDAIELFNEGTESVDLAGLHLSNDSSNPAKYTFPADTVLAAGGYLVVYANNPDGTPGLHVGFTLNGEGDEVYLSDRDLNMTRLDAVKFGLQLPDLSVGRFDGVGDWKLTQPSFGAANVAQPTGSLAALRINEWLAAGVAPFAEDFIELYNHNAAPVDLGRCYFTDEPTGAPTRHQIPPLTFMAGNSFLAFTADGTKGPRHVNFALKADGDQIGFLDPAQKPVDVVLFGPQKSGVSEGRCPDGLNTFGPLATPTPGAPNVCATVVALRYDSVWKYDATGTDRGTTWKDIDYDDSAWPAGPAVLGHSNFESNSIPEFILTDLPLGGGRTTYYFRTTFVLPAGVAGVQMTHIIDDGAIFYLNGQELTYRYNMPPGAVGATVFAQSTVDATISLPISLPIDLLLPGTNWLAVEVHQASANSSDVAFALKLEITPGVRAGGGLVLNEILSNNHTLAEPDGTTPDWVEIFNATDAPIDLSDFSLTDDVTNPRRYVFPINTLLASQSHLRVLFDSATPVSATNAGFRLKSTGDSMYLFNAPAAGAGLVDFLTYGLQAADYSLGRIPDGGTNWVLNVPTPDALNTAAALGDPLQLKVNEWLANPSSGEDMFEIFNPSAQPVALAGLWLTDDLRSPAARMKSKIPRLSFIGTGFQGYQEFIADRQPQNGPDHVNFSLGAGGEALGISQGNGTLINGVTFGAQALGVSQGRFPDGSTSFVTFPASASFGEMNWLPLTSLIINEVLTHTDPPIEDAIELFNSGAASVNLTGWYLSNTKDNLKKYPITSGLTIPAGGFRVFYETQFNHSALAPNNFTLNSAHGGDVYLSAATDGVLTGYRTHVSFDAAENGVSFGLYKNSVGQNDFVAMSAHTFGVDSPVGVAQFRTGGGLPNAYPKVGPVVFSEIMFQPALLGTNDNTRDEFIELFNPTAAAVPLFDPAYPTNHWRLRGGVDFDFPPEVSLGATSALLIVSFDPTNDLVALADFKMAHGITSDVPILGPWIGKLSNSGESLSLQKPDAVQLAPHPDAGFVPYVTVEKLTYGSVLPWPTNAAGTGRSLQRVSLSSYGNEPINWIGAAPAPGRAGRAAPTDECIFALSSTRAAFKTGGGVSNVLVLGPENCPWEVINTNSWVQITSGPSGFGSGVVHYTVTKNTKLRPRTGTLLIAGQPFLVIQSDTGKPMVALVSPAAKIKVFTNASVTLQGTAKDLVGVARVEYSLNLGSYLPASGRTNWTAGITLLAGKNVLRLRSVDLAGNLSPVLARIWRYNPPVLPVAGLGLRSGAILPGPDRRANFVFPVSPGSNYVLWSSADLVHWESLGVQHATTSTLTFTNLVDPSLQQMFFKLQPAP